MREKTATTDDDDADSHIGHGSGGEKRDGVHFFKVHLELVCFGAGAEHAVCPAQ